MRQIIMQFSTDTHTVTMTECPEETKPDCAMLCPQPLIKPVNLPIYSAQLLIFDTVYII